MVPNRSVCKSTRGSESKSIRRKSEFNKEFRKKKKEKLEKRVSSSVGRAYR